jgi:alcohol dehydrogenase (cytochrome c)
MKFMAHGPFAAVILATGFGIASAQVPFNRLLNAQSDSQNWLTYNGNLKSTHYSMLDQINPGNVANLDLKWVYQIQSLEKFEATPLVVDGVMYVSEPPNNVAAIDTRTGRPYWVYERPLPETTYVCCGNINRGLAILGSTLFMGTIDAHLLALDASTGRKKWETKVADYTQGYAVTVAPLVVKNLVIIGTAGGERGISGFLAAYDAQSGKEMW